MAFGRYGGVWRSTAPVWGAGSRAGAPAGAQPTTARRLQRYPAASVENFNRPNAVARFARIAQAMGVETR